MLYDRLLAIAGLLVTCVLNWCLDDSVFFVAAFWLVLHKPVCVLYIDLLDISKSYLIVVDEIITSCMSASW